MVPDSNRVFDVAFRRKCSPTPDPSSQTHRSDAKVHSGRNAEKKIFKTNSTEAFLSDDHIPGPLGVDARIERRETSQERCRRYKQWMRCHGQEWTTANKIRFINGCRSKDKTISLSQGSSLLPGWCMRRSSTCRGGGTRSWNANPWGCKGWSRLMLVGWRVAGRATPTGRPEQWAPIKTKQQQQQQQPGKRKWGCDGANTFRGEMGMMLDERRCVSRWMVREKGDDHGRHWVEEENNGHVGGEIKGITLQKENAPDRARWSEVNHVKKEPKHELAQKCFTSLSSTTVQTATISSHYISGPRAWHRFFHLSNFFTGFQRLLHM